MIRKIIAVSCLMSFTYLPLTAQTQDPMQLNPNSPWYKLDADSGWHFDLGLGVELEPTYAGSKNSETEPDGLARALYRTNSGHRYFASLSELGMIYSISPRTQLLAFLEREEGREGSEDEPLLDGLDKIDSTIEGQFTLARRFGNSSLFATLQPDLTGDANKGLVWFVGGTHDWLSKNSKWRLGTSLDISGGNSEYMQTEFGINQQESARTGYRSYTPSAGLKSATLGLSAEYYINDKFSILSSLEVENYLGDAKDSPLVKDLGDSTNLGGNILFRWRF